MRMPQQPQQQQQPAEPATLHAPATGTATGWDRPDRVTSTAIDALLGKLSARDKGYFAYDGLERSIDPGFCPELSRNREPLMNRGYFARVDTIRCVVLTFMQSVFDAAEAATRLNTFDNNRPAFQIVNVGAGLDPFYFWLKAEVERAYQLTQPKRFKYIELDLPELLAEKNKNIRRIETDETMAAECILSKNATVYNSTVSIPASSSGIKNDEFQPIIIHSPDYIQVPCDLRNIDLVETKCQNLLDPNLPTLFLVECVMVYLEASEGDALLRWMSTRAVPNAAVCLCQYEPFNPTDRFGTTMSRNLARRGCALRSLHDYSSLEAHVKRYQNCGWEEISIANMYSIYNECLDPINRMRIEQLELFDEMEEWRLIQQHYFASVSVRHARDRTDYFPLTSLVAFWEECRVTSDGGNNCGAVPRFSTEELRKTSSHLDVLEKVASKMLKRRESADGAGTSAYSSTGRASFAATWYDGRLGSTNSYSDLSGRASLDAHGIRKWLQNPLRSSPRICAAASAPDMNLFQPPPLHYQPQRANTHSSSTTLGCVPEEQQQDYNINNMNSYGDDDDITQPPRMVADVLKDLMKK